MPVNVLFTTRCQRLHDVILTLKTLVNHRLVPGCRPRMRMRRLI